MEEFLKVVDKRIAVLKRENYKRFFVGQIFTIIGTTLLLTFMALVGRSITGYDNLKLFAYAFPVVGVLWLFYYVQSRKRLNESSTACDDDLSISPIAESLLINIRPSLPYAEKTTYIVPVLLYAMELGIMDVQVKDLEVKVEDFDLQNPNKEVQLKFVKNIYSSLIDNLSEEETVLLPKGKRILPAKVVTFHSQVFFMNILQLLVKEIEILSENGLCKEPSKQESLTIQYSIAEPTEKAFKIRSSTLDSINEYIKRNIGGLEDRQILLKLFRYGVVLGLEDVFYEYLYNNSSKKDFIQNLAELYKAVYWSLYCVSD